MIRRKLFAVLVVPWLATPAALAQTATPAPDTLATGSIGLRGGFDSNPTDSEGGRGSAFETQTFSFDYLRGAEQEGIGVKLAGSNTLYDPRVAAPSTSVVAALTAALRPAPNLTLRTSLTTTVDDSWSRRSQAEQWHNRIEYETSQFRVFANLDATVTALNERNIFANGGFLPSDENFVTVTALSGAAYKTGFGEFGASVAASRVDYLEDSDYLGLDRSHDTLQPNAFFSANLRGAELEGSVSPFAANFDTSDFDPVRQLLYTAKAKIPLGAWTLGLGSTRTVQDTTLPFSAIDLTQAHEASVSYKFDAHNAVNFTARFKRDDYLGLGAWSTTLLGGVDFAHDFGGGLLGTATASVRQVKQPGETLPWSLNLQIGLQKQFDFGGGQKAAADNAAGAKPPAS
ncbi:hypothetical protein [Methylocapsa sp. S129]|uniref:hypothetical protein n=1 Tax=Methylocapsa sp. S129 TaxID=1641869 RepID=UPI00131D6075|nr:hypothetical protein [Methylocapsa sp. S129]